MTLAELQQVHVDWTCRTPRGASGRGKVDAQVPTSSGAEALRGFVDAAFSAAIDEVGAEAGPKAVEAAMDRRLSALLPKDHRIVTLEVQAVETFVLTARPAEPVRGGAGPAGPAPQKGCGLVGIFLLVASGSCCLLFGVAGFGAGSEWSAAQAAARRAPVMSAAAAAKASGLVCVEGVTAQVDSALRVEGAGEVPYLVLVETESRQERYTERSTRHLDEDRRVTVTEERTRTVKGDPVRRVVPRFAVGPLVVVTDGAQWDGEAALAATRVSGASTFAYTGLRADVPLTIVGHAQAGTLGKGGETFVISTQPNQAALVARLGSLSTGSRVFGGFALAAGALLLVLALVKVVKR